MPRKANHDVRRAGLIEVAAGLIAESGMDGLTVREVAKAAGVSTGVVSHYFSDKRELLQATYDATADEVYRRVERLASSGGGVQECLEGFLPLDSERQRGWRVWFAFWGLAIGDKAFAIDQKKRARRAQKLVARILAVNRDRGQTRPDVDVEMKARMILGLIQGIAAQTVFDPKDWPPKQQSRMLAAALRDLIRQ